MTVINYDRRNVDEKIYLKGNFDSSVCNHGFRNADWMSERQRI